jgi:hypothetical protein
VQAAKLDLKDKGGKREPTKERVDKNEKRVMKQISRKVKRQRKANRWNRGAREVTKLAASARALIFKHRRTKVDRSRDRERQAGSRKRKNQKRQK